MLPTKPSVKPRTGRPRKDAPKQEPQKKRESTLFVTLDAETMLCLTAIRIRYCEGHKIPTLADTVRYLLSTHPEVIEARRTQPEQ